MPKFLTVNETYRILQRELPEGVYPDGAPSAYFSTADNYSIAKTVETLYSNLETIQDNNFPQNSDERISDWSRFVFGYSLSAALSLAEKRSRILAKLRKEPAITLWEILTLVVEYVPDGTYVQVSSPCSGIITWQLGVSELGFDTYLQGVTFDSLGIDGEDWCEEVANLHWRLGQDALGETTELAEFAYTDIAAIQADAYLYDIRIFGYEIPENELIGLRQEIEKAEPARSTYRLTQNANLLDYGLTTIVNDVTQFDLVDTITKDAGSSTGYTGLTT